MLVHNNKAAPKAETRMALLLVQQASAHIAASPNSTSQWGSANCVPAAMMCSLA